jgi:hypothetical protein
LLIIPPSAIPCALYGLEDSAQTGNEAVLTFPPT